MGVPIPGRDKRFVSSPKRPYRLSVLTILLFHGNEKLFPRGWNRSRRETDQASPSRTEVKKEWSCNSSPAIYLHGLHNKTLLSSHLRLGLSSDLFCSYQIWDFCGGNCDRTRWQKFSVVLLASYRTFKKVTTASFPLLRRRRRRRRCHYYQLDASLFPMLTFAV